MRSYKDILITVLRRPIVGNATPATPPADGGSTSDQFSLLIEN